MRLHYGGHRNLRQDASDYLDDAEDGVVVLNGLHIIRPSSNAEIDNPVRLRFWHNTSHYAGVKVLLVDKDGSILASYSPPEVSSFNEVLWPLEAEVPYRKPKSTEGFIAVVNMGFQER